MRIWHQSLIPETAATKPYFLSLEAHVGAVASKDTEVVLHGLDPALYSETVGPAVFASFAVGELLEAELTARNVLTAARAGFDAFIIATLQDPGLQVGRTLTDIPVVGYGQAAALIGRCLGDRLGLLAFNRPLFPLFRERLEVHVPGCVGPMQDLDITYEDLMEGLVNGGIGVA